MTAPYTAAELAAISARAEAATEGPWRVIEPPKARPDDKTPLIGNVVAPDGDAELGNWMVAERVVWKVNRDFIAAARSDVPRLVAELTRAREALQTYQRLSLEAFKLLDADQDMKTMKLLRAMAGNLPGYRADTDELSRAALGEEPSDGDTER
jgi:hypothetical protein